MADAVDRLTAVVAAGSDPIELLALLDGDDGLLQTIVGHMLQAALLREAGALEDAVVVLAWCAGQLRDVLGVARS